MSAVAGCRPALILLTEVHCLSVGRPALPAGSSRNRKALTVRLLPEKSRLSTSEKDSQMPEVSGSWPERPLLATLKEIIAPACQLGGVSARAHAVHTEQAELCWQCCCAWGPCTALTCVVVTGDLLKVAEHLRRVPSKLLPEGVHMLLHLEEGPETAVQAFSCKAEVTRLAISPGAEVAAPLRSKGSLNSIPPCEHGNKVAYHLCRGTLHLSTVCCLTWSDVDHKGENHSAVAA